MASDDPEAHARVLRTVARAVAEMGMDDTPPSMGQVIHRVVREATGVEDPYRGVKDHFNALALSLYPRLKSMVAESDDPFGTAVRLAVAGNIIDFGVRSDIDEESLERSISESLAWPLDDGALDALRRAVDSADDILYVGDNAGEIVFDRVLIEEMDTDRVTFVVRGAPIINDVTMRDAVEVGMTDIVTVVDNGSDAPGTILGDCSREFRERFRRSEQRRELLGAMARLGGAYVDLYLLAIRQLGSFNLRGEAGSGCGDSRPFHLCHRVVMPA